MGSVQTELSVGDTHSTSAPAGLNLTPSGKFRKARGGEVWERFGSKNGPLSEDPRERGLVGRHVKKPQTTTNGKPWKTSRSGEQKSVTPNFRRRTITRTGQWIRAKKRQADGDKATETDQRAMWGGLGVETGNWGCG